MTHGVHWTAVLAVTAGALITTSCRDTGIACADCTVALDTLVTLAFDTLPAPSASLRIATNRQASRIALTPSRSAGEVLVFDAVGRHVMTLGRLGSGPGEYRDIAAMVFDEADTLIVIDRRNERIDFYSSTGSLVRSSRLDGAVWGVALAGDSALIVQGTPSTAEWVGYKARLISRHGRVRPVAEERDAQREDDFGSFLRPIGRAEHGGFWLAKMRDYTVTRFTSDGDSAWSITSDPQWFRTRPANADRFEGVVETRSAVTGVTEDTIGNLWVLSRTPEARYPDVDFAHGDINVDRRVLDAMTDHVVQAFDSRNGALLASMHSEYFPMLALPYGRAALFDEASDAEPELVVVQFVLKRGNPKGRSP